ncbi:polysaccharide export protein [Chitinispirillum alkaliphilum]|nr:polysaccharide export protein [Chitinispirillum alkaliphilum]
MSERIDTTAPTRQQNRLHPQHGNPYVDETKYIIGFGDVFYISVIDMPSVQYRASIDLNGNMYIPELGLVKIGNVPLYQAKNVIKEFVKSKISSNKRVYVSMIDIKNVTVYFSGKIDLPGMQNLPGNTRLFDAMKGIGIDMAAPGRINLREISVSNENGTNTYDLLNYLYANDISQNPYLSPGDRINVPPVTNKVFVNGEVANPPAGVYPLRENETTGEFLSLFTLSSSADTSNITIQRTSTGESFTINSFSENIELKDLDVITVPVKKNHPRISTVSITGEIARPGQFPIIENATTAQQIIDQAGGAKETGSIDQAVIIRHNKSLSAQFGENARSLGGVRPELGSSLALLTASADHTVIRLSQRGFDVVLEPNDQVLVPKRENFVYVSGNVRQPGAYEYVPGENRSFYIRQAGGLSRNADRSNIKVVKRYDRAYQMIDSREVEAGSIIVVPASTQYRFFSTVFIPLVSALATTIGVGVAIYNSR